MPKSLQHLSTISLTKLRGPPASVSEHNGKSFDDFLRHARQARAKKKQQ